MSVSKTPIVRRISRQVMIGNIAVGGNAPVVVQSMTNTDTADAKSTVNQILELWQAGSEIVRITVNSAEAAEQVSNIRGQLDAMGCTVPLVGDFHYNGHKLLSAYPDCAVALAKYRINPGNVGKGSKRDEQFSAMIEAAIQYDKPVRIGVNWGSLDQEKMARMMDENAKSSQPLSSDALMREALIQSALESAEQAESIGLKSDKIVISCKVSDVQDLVTVYRDLAKRCDYALHLGLTEAGMGSKGIVASTACPGCGRTTSTYFQELAQDIQRFLRAQMPVWRKQYPGVESMSVAVMGCVVNGPGESKLANIGISLPGTGEIPVAPVFVDGEKTVTLKGDAIAQEFQVIVEQYVQENYAEGGKLRTQSKTILIQTL